MFKLVGTTLFAIMASGKKYLAEISIDANGFNYLYKLSINGNPVSSFSERMRVINKTFRFQVDGQEHLVVLGSCASACGMA